MQTAVVLIIVFAAAAYLLLRAYKTSRAARQGEAGCACCSEKKLCAKAAKCPSQDSRLTPLEPRGPEE